MKLITHFKKTTNLLFLTLAVWCLTALDALAQIPRNVPQPGSDQQLDLTSPWHIVFFIVVPVFMIAYLFYTMSRRPKKEDEETKEEEKNDNEKSE